MKTRFLKAFQNVQSLLDTHRLCIGMVWVSELHIIRQLEDRKCQFMHNLYLFSGDAGVHVKHSLNFIEEQLPGVYIKSVQIGSSITEVILIMSYSL